MVSGDRRGNANDRVEPIVARPRVVEKLRGPNANGLRDARRRVDGGKIQAAIEQPDVLRIPNFYARRKDLVCNA
jgi:hypothetical protein